MDILILQNDPITPAGIVEERIVARGGTMTILHPHAGDPLPRRADGFAAAVVLGGPMSATDDVSYPAFVPAIELLRDFHRRDKPLLGLCLGAQLLARCFDRPVRPHTALELGFVPITITEEGARDPLLSGFARTQRLMQWHEDTFEMPDGAVPLMTGTACRNQAFRIGRATYGFQCHFEVTPEIVAAWLQRFGNGLPRHLGDAAPGAVRRVLADAAAHRAATRAFAETVSDRWLDLCRGLR